MKITTEPVHDKWEIHAENYGIKTVAGPRLFRGLPHPDIKFGIYDQRIEVEKDAQKLRDHLDRLPKKKISKAKLRKQGAD